MDLAKYEDKVRLQTQKAKEEFSPFLDIRLVKSTVTPGVVFAIRVLKPKKPSYIVAGTHGWHMSIDKFSFADKPQSKFLTVDVDMRGRAFSTGDPDCNGYELYDVYDAINFVKKEYAEYIIDPDVVYFEAGSGGGGNALAIAAKFPDLFSAVNAMCPIADYAEWYRFDDKIMEFRDEMDIWIGCKPEDDPEAYASRSGIDLLPNLMTHLLICHGTADLRVPFYPSERYVQKAKKIGKGDLVDIFRMHGVGTREHWGNIKDRQMAIMLGKCLRNIQNHKEKIEIPEKGEFLVGSFLVTKKFSVFTDIDKVVRIRYDLKKKTVEKVDKKDANTGIKVVWH